MISFTFSNRSNAKITTIFMRKKISFLILKIKKKNSLSADETFQAFFIDSNYEILKNKQNFEENYESTVAIKF